MVDAVHSPLPRPLRGGHLSGEDLSQLSSELGKAWMWVGRLLGLDDSSLDGIKEAYDQQFEWCYEMLRLWTQRNSTQATYQWLAQALLHQAVGKRDLAEKYCIVHREQGNGKSIHMRNCIHICLKIILIIHEGKQKNCFINQNLFSVRSRIRDSSLFMGMTWSDN